MGRVYICITTRLTIKFKSPGMLLQLLVPPPLLLSLAFDSHEQMSLMGTNAGGKFGSRMTAALVNRQQIWTRPRGM